MTCRECGAHVAASDFVCGNCGAVLDQSSTAPQPVLPPSPPASPARRTARRISSTTLLIVLFSCGLISLIVASAVGGVVIGLQDRETDRQAEADRYYQEGLANFASGKLELAKADFEYVLRLDPAYPGAQEQIAQVTDRLTVKPTPTSAALTSAIDQLYETGLTAYQAQKWATAIDALAQVRSIDPAYQAAQVSQYLFDASVTYGLELIEADRLEEAIAYLDQAAYIRPLPAAAALQAQYAKLYLTARGYWNVNWERAIERFTELYAFAPGYKDTFARLVGSYVEYGNERVRAGDSCTAQKQYEEAIKLSPGAALQAKLDQATQVCLTATPAPISGTAQSLAGLFTGRIAYPVADTNGQRIDAASAGNPIVYTAAYGDQPEFERAGSQVAYRTGGGLYIGSRNVAPAGAAWPTLSPDGQRLIHALQGRLYLVNLSGGDPVDLGAGSAPTWGPNGLLAYAGCDSGGTCGIMFRDPDKTDPPVRLTGSANDVPSSWSPDGFNISYYSNVNGDYDLFFCNTAGGVQQVTSGPGNDVAGAWGPDGAHVAFLSDRDGTWSVYIAKYDGTELTKIAIAPQGGNWATQRVSWLP
ncbi:MAG: PD40 domain-containing protein [Thermoflexales bacterium]|nr:PD40 domain-containing protein [Thermoflexales bacterium]